MRAGAGRLIQQLCLDDFRSQGGDKVFCCILYEDESARKSVLVCP